MTVGFVPLLPQDREAFLAERKTGIGASDAPVVCGLSPWKTPLELYMEKKGLVPLEEGSEASYWGTVLEAVVLREYARRRSCFVLTRPAGLPDPYLITPAGEAEPWTGIRREIYPIASGLEELLGTVRHPDHPFLMVHIDGLALVPEEDGVLYLYRPLEGKTSSAYRGKEWGTEESDEIPEEYVVQAQHTMGILAALEYTPAADRCDVPVLIGGQRWKAYTVERDPKFFEALVALESEFWRRLEEEDPPEAERTAAGLRALSRLYPKGSGAELVANDLLTELAQELARTDADRKAADDAYQAAEVRFKEAMGVAPAVVGLGWRVTWKEQVSPPRYKAVAEELAGGAIPQEIIDRHRGEPTRVFRKYLNNLEV